jgi:hypothetical protein
MSATITREEVRALAAAKRLPLTDAQIAKVHGSVQVMRECAGRLRAGLHRNDEPAFGFRHPQMPTVGKEAE